MPLHPLVGHDASRQALLAAHHRREVPAALLIQGPAGVGKQRLALWLGQLLLCEAPGADGPCDACKACTLVLRLEHPDLHWYFPLERPRGASGDRLGSALEEARRQALEERRREPVVPSYRDHLAAYYLPMVQTLRRAAHSRASMADGPVFIVGEAEELVPQEASQESANAMLKLLEEPPGAARFILTASEPGRLLPTIRSRTVPLRVPPLETAEVASFLREYRGVDEKTATWAARLAEGSIGRALAFLPDDEGEPGPLEQLRRAAYRVVRASLDPRGGHRDGLALEHGSVRARRLADLLYFVDAWLRDLGAVASGAGDAVLNRDAAQELARLAGEAAIPPAHLVAALARVDEARVMARGNVMPQLVLKQLMNRLHRLLHTPAA